jgi:diguanylate cyclase (GGDEF)-like protein/PAS domain S-box-containing protein
VKSHSSFETKVLLAFMTAVLVVIALASITWLLANNAAKTAILVSRNHEVLHSLARVMRDTIQVESSTQNYRISGNPDRLEERDAAIRSRENSLNLIRQLTANNARQQEHMTRLNEVINERLAISRKIEQLRKTQGVEAANAYIAGVPLQETRERTYKVLRNMEIEESQLLDSRRAELLSVRQNMVTSGAIVSLCLLLLLSATYLLIRRQLQTTEVSRLALVNSEESLSTTLHSIGDAVLATDTDTRITRMNPVAEQLTGWSFAQAQGRPVNEVIHLLHAQTRASAVLPTTQVLETGEIQELANHTILVARDGTEYPIADSAAPIRNSKGQITGVVLVFRDMTIERQARTSILKQNELLEQHVLERTAQLRESEEHLRSVIASVPAMIAYVNSEQRYVYANQQYLDKFAPSQNSIAGRTVREILGEERYATAGPRIAKALSGEPQNYDWQPFPGVWQAISYAVKQNEQGQVEGYYVMGTEISERKQAEKKIQALNTELEQHVCDLERISRAHRTLSSVNRTMLRSTEKRELLDNMCRTIVVTGSYGMAVVWYRVDDDAKSLLPMAEHGYPGGIKALNSPNVSWSDDAKGNTTFGIAIRTGQTVVARDMLNDPQYAAWRPFMHGMQSGVACPLHVNGEVIGALAIYDTDPNTFTADEVALLKESAEDLAFGIATFRARAVQQKNQEQIYKLTRFDALTGLPNETQFTEFLAAAIQNGKQFQQPFAVLQTNIERLSEINDALGFSHGDQLLQEFSKRLSAAVPESAKLARLRGDEFAILLPDCSANGAISMTRQLDEILAHPFPIAELSLNVSAKIGVALFPEHGATPHDLFRHMDIAMHQAKKLDVRHVVFNPDKNQDQSHRLNMAGELRRAIEGGDLLLYLQPKIVMATGRVCGAEGLVRWKHPQRGMIMPGEFISLAEHTGLIKPLTEWVITAGLRLNAEWQKINCALPIAINLSIRNLRDENLSEKIRQLQNTWGVAAGLLELEITESTVMDDAEFSLRVLQNLHDQGIPLYLDDFGTGYSSLSYLLQLPVNYIKIDQSFVRNMSASKDSSMIVRSTIDLTHDLGRMVVAEGIETQEQWNKLAALGCDVAQGYFIARPMPAEEFPTWLSQFSPPITG